MSDQVLHAEPGEQNAEPAQRKVELNDTTRSALVSTMLTPRFYTTDFDEMDRINVEPGAANGMR